MNNDSFKAGSMMGKSAVQAMTGRMPSPMTQARKKKVVSFGASAINRAADMLRSGMGVAAKAASTGVMNPIKSRRQPWDE